MNLNNFSPKGRQVFFSMLRFFICKISIILFFWVGKKISMKHCGNMIQIKSLMCIYNKFCHNNFCCLLIDSSKTDSIE